MKRHRDPRLMTTFELWTHLQTLPPREIDWRDVDKMIRDEYDRRILALDAKRGAAA